LGGGAMQFSVALVAKSRPEIFLSIFDT